MSITAFAANVLIPGDGSAHSDMSEDLYVGQSLDSEEHLGV